ncbi:MAG: ribosomal assembly protein [Thermoproteota archaeon]|nr:ribosomal assembly protein [Thermoproteota archaeon]
MSENIIRTKIPVERIGVLIGAEGTAKRTIEEKFNVIVEVDSKTGDVEIKSDTKSPDPTTILRVRDMILAIGRGFSPERALRLLNEEVTLGIIDLRDIFGKSESDIQRVKGRIIGKNGKTRQMIEELTGANVSVYGHTISIIGELDQFEVTKEAIDMLIEGRMHKSVYGFLYRKRADLKKNKLELWKPPLPKPIDEE